MEDFRFCGYKYRTPASLPFALNILAIGAEDTLKPTGTAALGLLLESYMFRPFLRLSFTGSFLDRVVRPVNLIFLRRRQTMLSDDLTSSGVEFHYSTIHTTHQSCVLLTLPNTRARAKENETTRAHKTSRLFGWMADKGHTPRTPRPTVSGHPSGFCS